MTSIATPRPRTLVVHELDVWQHRAGRGGSRWRSRLEGGTLTRRRSGCPASSRGDGRVGRRRQPRTAFPSGRSRPRRSSRGSCGVSPSEATGFYVDDRRPRGRARWGRQVASAPHRHLAPSGDTGGPPRSPLRDGAGRRAPRRGIVHRGGPHARSFRGVTATDRMTTASAGPGLRLSPRPPARRQPGRGAPRSGRAHRDARCGDP